VFCTCVTTEQECLICQQMYQIMLAIIDPAIANV